MKKKRIFSFVNNNTKPDLLSTSICTTADNMPVTGFCKDVPRSTSGDRGIYKNTIRQYILEWW